MNVAGIRVENETSTIGSQYSGATVVGPTPEFISMGRVIRGDFVHTREFIGTNNIKFTIEP